jgi:hypothetical protein
MRKNKTQTLLPSGEILLYQTEGGRMKLKVRPEHETVWLTQQVMPDLFQTTKQNVSLHIQCIIDEGEPFQEATVKDFLTVRQEGQRQIQCSVSASEEDSRHDRRSTS